MRIVLLSSLALVASLLTTSPATAILIGYDSIVAPDAPWIRASPTVGYRFEGSTSYNAAADILTLTTSPTASQGIGSSSFFLIAGVDGTGKLLGGSAIWLGEIASLGVPPGSILLKGDVIAVDYGFLGAPTPVGQFGLDFVIQVEQSLPALGLGPTVGYSNFIIPWRLDFSPNDPPVPAWSTSFDDFKPTTRDGLFNVVRVPQAPTLILFLGSIGLWLASLARRTRWSTGHRERRAECNAQWRRASNPSLSRGSAGTSHGRTR